MKNTLPLLRKQHSITQLDFARRIGVSRQTIISIENGKYNPSLELAFKIANIFDLKIEDIFIFKEESDEE